MPPSAATSQYADPGPLAGTCGALGAGPDGGVTAVEGPLLMSSEYCASDTGAGDIRCGSSSHIRPASPQSRARWTSARVAGKAAASRALSAPLREAPPP